MPNEAILSNDKNYTSFSFNGYNIRFMTSPSLLCYTSIKEWDNGYLVVTAKYSGRDNVYEEEEYIDLIPILENLYIDSDSFLSPIKTVRIA